MQGAERPFYRMHALLLSPGIEQKAKAFCEQLDAEKDGQ